MRRLLNETTRMIHTDDGWIRINKTEQHPESFRIEEFQASRRQKVIDQGLRQKMIERDQKRPKICGECKYCVFRGINATTLKTGSCSKSHLHKRYYVGYDEKICEHFRMRNYYSQQRLNMRAESLPRIRRCAR